jgi:hypothetical protein
MGSQARPLGKEENALRDLWINYNWIRHKGAEIAAQQPPEPSASHEELLDDLEDLWMLLAIQLRMYLQIYPDRDSDPRVFSIINQLIRDARLVPSSS